MSEYKKVKLGDICKIVKGSTGIASSIPGEYPLVVTAVERKTCSTYQFDCEAVCIPLVSSSGHGKKSLNNVHYQKGKFALGTILCAVIPNNPEEVSAAYLHQYLQFYKDTVLVPLMKGAANVSLSMRDIATVEIPLPDFKTQSELSKMFVEMQNKQKEINAEFEKQSAYAKQLRQNILQDAIEGKLTAEWRKTHPVIKGNPDFDAEALFEEIQKGKAFPSLQPAKQSSATPSPRGSTPKTPENNSETTDNSREFFEKKLVSERKRTTNARSKELPQITDDEKPFEIPEGWKWVRLGNVIQYTENLDIQKKLQPNEIVNYVDIDSIDNNKYKIESPKEKYVSELSSRARRVLKQGFIIYSTVRPYLCNMAIIEEQKKNFIGSTGFNVFKPIYLNIHYIFNFFLSPYVIKLYKSMMQGFNSPSINNDQFENTIVPLPPLKEQEEIVNKIESLLNKVTELENQIQERKQLSEKLVFGVIKEKLER